MTNIDSDDPLGEFLSDGSDSFFAEVPKVLAKRASLTKTPDKKSISDLFGLNDDVPKEKPQQEPDWLGLGGTETDLPKTTHPKPTKKISFEDDDDILNTLGFDNKKPDAPKKMETTTKKISLMQSILDPPNQVVKPKVEKSTPSAQKPEVLGYPATDVSREGRRSRHQRSGSGLVDPLGLFAVETSEPKEEPKKVKPILGEGDAGTAVQEVLLAPKPKSDLKTKSASNIKDLPEWLGGGSPVKTYKSDTGIPKTEVKQTDPHTDQIDSVPTNTEVNAENPALESLFTQQKLATSHIEYQNTSIALQQQESQLLMALQLKKYEENLGNMQRKQQDVLIRQEQQFNSLLERQFAKQQVMENNMRLQQERINSHIQMLISQPPVAGKFTNDAQEETDQLKRSNADENSRLYEEMIATLKQRQHEEIFLLNESYKKQISLLENSMESVESRLKAELTNLSEQFRNILDHNKKDHDAEIDKYKQKLQEMSVLHVNEIKLIRENHNRIIEEIKYEYSTMVENMKQVKQAENSILDNASAYKQKLDSNLEVLDGNSRILNEIQERVRQDYGVLSLAREESTKAKEEEIKLMRITLEKSRESTDMERAQLMTLVRSLEMKLMEQNQNGKEERWALQQAAAVLAARSAAFDREVEFSRSSIDREKDQLKTLKQTMLAEQEKLMLHLTEEKLSLSAEKSRLETSAKLNHNYDSQKARAEIDAAVQVAKEAAELTDRERETLHRQQSEIEILKRNLLDKERKINLKEAELQEMFRNADRKAHDGEKALADAKALEAKYNARLRDIQGQLMSLMGREKKVAEEKIALSKERLALHNNLRQIKKCGLCATDNLKPEDSNYEDEVVEQDFTPRIVAVTDPDILRLRYEISEGRLLLPNDEEGDATKL